MLFAVRGSPRFVAPITLVILMPVCAVGAHAPGSGTARGGPPTSSEQTTGQQQSPSPPAPPRAPTAVPAPARVYQGPIIVIDPAHGGTDTGARGESGAIEKDLVLDYGRMLRSELESQGWRVVLTRDDDSNPSYADRAAMANAYRGAIFISLHVSSTGPLGTVRTYYYQFGSVRNTSATRDASSKAALPASSLVSWEDAQRAQVQASRALAEDLQAQLARSFAGSPATPAHAAVRELRSVDAPAVAVEVSSVSAQDPNALAALAGPLAVSIARGVQAFRAATAGKEN